MCATHRVSRRVPEVCTQRVQHQAEGVAERVADKPQVVAAPRRPQVPGRLGQRKVVAHICALCARLHHKVDHLARAQRRPPRARLGLLHVLLVECLQERQRDAELRSRAPPTLIACACYDSTCDASVRQTRHVFGRWNMRSCCGRKVGAAAHAKGGLTSTGSKFCVGQAGCGRCTPMASCKLDSGAATTSAATALDWTRPIQERKRQHRRHASPCDGPQTSRARNNVSSSSAAQANGRLRSARVASHRPSLAFTVYSKYGRSRQEDELRLRSFPTLYLVSDMCVSSWQGLLTNVVRATSCRWCVAQCLRRARGLVSGRRRNTPRVGVFIGL